MNSGIQNFPLEVILNDKMNLLEAEYGTKGFGIMIKLYQYIYTKGYYTQWDMDVGCLFMRERCPDMGWQLVSEVVACAVRRGIFDKDMYENNHILTSARIQETYLFATKRRTKVELDKKYLLPIAYTFLNNVDILSNYVNKNGENVSKNGQRKGEKRKEEERRGGEPRAPTLQAIEAFIKERQSPVNAQRFYDYYNANEWKDIRGNVIINWKAKLISWEKDEGKPKGAQSEVKVERTYTADELNNHFDNLKYEDI